MKEKALFTLMILSFFVSSLKGQNKDVKRLLSAVEFSEKIMTITKPVIIDVRTREEFTKGHLPNAVNFDWNNSENFENQTAKLDKSKPYFIYCLSGSRSADASEKLNRNGFKEIYDLKGGILKWRAANLPQVIDTKATPKGLTKKQFDELANSKKIVLIDFYADWCGPCRKMKPYLEEIANNMKDKVEVIRINADDNQKLCKELNIDALPVLKLFKNKELTWSNVGFITKDDVLKQLQ
ncbi:thioredoxin domain-containing protein [Flavobacterium soyangense]|uniref:Redoxin family protein n=1 Tax=Flavobacterium soyangense TaxID=2023265 RepID=A0A930XWX6_9FLAO|nr:thioredoxin domain-containing protein [Flavobacterium soyangense]MBF2709861.1 redoxin family protein [Flavobacterium soyangense]